MKQPTIKELLDKIARLEARIVQLEARPPAQIHNHYHNASPVYGPIPISPTAVPFTLPWTTTCRSPQ